MKRLADFLDLKGNPFEHYTAETEPHISEYAVKPPYLEAISARARSLSSFILFGDRGAGKSATRITLYNEIWRGTSTEAGSVKNTPIAVNFVDFTRALPSFKKDTLTENELIADVAFFVVEQTLAWLASLSDDDRDLYTGTLTKDENELIVGILKNFYLNRPEIERARTQRSALSLLNQAWKTRSSLWIGKKWEPLSKLIAVITESLTKKIAGGPDGIAGPIEQLLQSASATGEASGRVVAEKLVDFVRIFGFSGVVILVDKVDETEATQNSAASTTQLIYPILSHVQLLEVEGFAWMFFLWAQVKPFMEGTSHKVRLDKIAHLSIDWDVGFFKIMLDARISYFSNQRLKFNDLFVGDTDIDAVITELVDTSMRSPRELVRLMDVIITEHDIRHRESPEDTLLNRESVELGLDKYVQERISAIYSATTLNQVFRLKDVVFINKDVQRTFRINDASARNKIRGWEDAGIVKQTGTRAAEGDLGGKPPYEYTVVDARVARIINKELIRLDALEDDDAEETAE